MRPIFQLALAGAIVVAAASSAFAILGNSCELNNAAKANITHTWTMTKPLPANAGFFDLLHPPPARRGSLTFGVNPNFQRVSYLDFFDAASRPKARPFAPGFSAQLYPTGHRASGNQSISVSMPFRHANNTHYSASFDTNVDIDPAGARLRSGSRTSFYLVVNQNAVLTLIADEDSDGPRGYTPVGGAVNVTHMTGAVAANVHLVDDQGLYDGVMNIGYDGKVLSGENANRTIHGMIHLMFKNAHLSD